MRGELQLIDPNGDPAGQAAAMDAACTSSGFFRIPASSVDEELSQSAWDQAAAFFALTPDQKAEAKSPVAGYPYGYSPFQYEALAASEGDTSPPDLKESFSVGPDCQGPSQTTNASEQWIRSPSIWPMQPAEMSEIWAAHYRSLATAAEQLLNIMAAALDLDDGHFEPLIDQHTSAMRAINYPFVAQPENADSLRAGAHTDYGTLTILRTDQVPGLEIAGPDGDWITVEPMPDTYVVNLGDSIARWTNDRWRSTMHRVTTVDPNPRQSMAFFHNANWDATIECLAGCEGPTGPKYEPVQAGPWLMSKYQRTVPIDD